MGADGVENGFPVGGVTAGFGCPLDPPAEGDFPVAIRCLQGFNFLEGCLECLSDPEDSTRGVVGREFRNSGEVEFRGRVPRRY